MAISTAGTFTSGSGTAATTLSFTSSAAGDLIVLSSLILSGTKTISSVAGHGATWLVGTRLSTTVGGATSVELWYGKVLTPGTANITITWGGGNAGLFTVYDAMGYTAGLDTRTVWALDVAGGQQNAAATTIAYPPLAPAGTGELYVGHAFGESIAVAAGSTPGFTYNLDSANNQYIYSTSVNASTSPTSGTTASQASAAIGVLISAGAPIPPTQPYTARRRAANF